MRISPIAIKKPQNFSANVKTLKTEKITAAIVTTAIMTTGAIFNNIIKKRKTSLLKISTKEEALKFADKKTEEFKKIKKKSEEVKKESLEKINRAKELFKNNGKDKYGRQIAKITEKTHACVMDEYTQDGQTKIRTTHFSKIGDCITVTEYANGRKNKYTLENNNLFCQFNTTGNYSNEKYIYDTEGNIESYAQKVTEGFEEADKPKKLYVFKPDGEAEKYIEGLNYDALRNYKFYDRILEFDDENKPKTYSEKVKIPLGYKKLKESRAIEIDLTDSKANGKT